MGNPTEIETPCRFPLGNLELSNDNGIIAVFSRTLFLLFSFLLFLCTNSLGHMTEIKAVFRDAVIRATKVGLEVWETLV